MNLQIVHLDKKKKPGFDFAAREKFESRILNHFHFNNKNVRGCLKIQQTNRTYLMACHFHLGKYHIHLHASDENEYKAFNHLLEELEREIERSFRKSSRKKRKRTDYMIEAA